MKILVIEDEPEMKGLIRQFLEDENYVVEEADNYRTGLDLDADESGLQVTYSYNGRHFFKVDRL